MPEISFKVAKPAEWPTIKEQVMAIEAAYPIDRLREARTRSGVHF